jgi:hypothetical protein
MTTALPNHHNRIWYKIFNRFLIHLTFSLNLVLFPNLYFKKDRYLPKEIHRGTLRYKNPENYRNKMWKLLAEIFHIHLIPKSLENIGRSKTGLEPYQKSKISLL